MVKQNEITNAFRNTFIVETIQRVIIYENIAPARFRLEFFNFINQLTIMTVETCSRIELLFHQPLLDKQLTRFYRVNAAVINESLFDDGNAV